MARKSKAPGHRPGLLHGGVHVRLRFFREIPTADVFVGSAIVAGSGLFVIWRERQRGIERIRTSAIEGPPVGIAK